MLFWLSLRTDCIQLIVFCCLEAGLRNSRLPFSLVLSWEQFPARFEGYHTGFGGYHTAH